jgi:hypothetical protein
LNSCAPLAIASASLAASTSPSHTALERRIKIDHRIDSRTAGTRTRDQLIKVTSWHA